MTPVTPGATAGSTPHLRRLPARSAARIRLVCIPHAGGGPSTFTGWARLVADDVEVAVVQPAGREARVRERPWEALDRFLPALIAAVPPDLPVVVFGHSWGAVVGLELVHGLVANGVDVAHLIVSGAPAPHCPRVLPPTAHLPKDELLAKLVELNGIPRELLRYDDLIDLILPALRADLRMAEEYRPPPRDPLPCPLTAFGGSDDPLADERSLDGWARYSVGGFRRVMFAGDHFFHISCRQAVVAGVMQAMAPGHRPP